VAVPRVRSGSILGNGYREVKTMKEKAAIAERPFVLAAIGWLTAAVGFLTVIGGLYRLGAGRGSDLVMAATILGAVEVIAGATLAFGSRIGYWAVRILTPVNLVISVVAVAMVGQGSLILWPVLFGFATVILWAPEWVAGRYQRGIREWVWRRPEPAAPTIADAEVESAAAEGRIAA
jgi:hypothetical protein